MQKVNGVAIYNGKQVVLDTPFQIDPAKNYGNDWGVFTLSETEVPIYLKFKTPEPNFACETPGKPWETKYWMCYLVNKKLVRTVIKEDPDDTEGADGKHVMWYQGGTTFGFLSTSTTVLIWSPTNSHQSHGNMLSAYGFSKILPTTSRELTKVELAYLKEMALDDDSDARLVLFPAGRIWKKTAKVVSFWCSSKKVTKQHIQMLKDHVGLQDDYLIEFLDSDANRMTVSEFLHGRQTKSDLTPDEFVRLMAKKHVGKLSPEEASAIRRGIQGFGSGKATALARKAGFNSVAAMHAVSLLSEDLMSIVSELAPDVTSIEYVEDVGSQAVKVTAKTQKDAETYYKLFQNTDGLRPLYYDEKIIVVKQDSEKSALLVN